MLQLPPRLSLGLVALLAFMEPASAAPAPARPARSVTLSDGWLFQPDPLGVGDAQGWQRPDLDRSGWRKVPVPMAWDFYDPVMDGFEGVGWYALELPAGLVAPGAWQRLRFNRANYRATVWIGGQRAGENLNGYVPFEIAASPFLKPGQPAWIVVRVENGTRWDWLPGATVVEWVQYGGLLEPVELLTTAPSYVGHVSIRATPRGSDGSVHAVIEVVNGGSKPFSGRVRLESQGRETEAEARIGPKQAARTALDLILPDAQRWSLEAPALHEAHVRLLDGGGDVDSVPVRFGVRSIETRGRQILLNGRPLRIRGVNRYDEFPRRGPVADDAAIRADLEAVKAAGANLVRMHYPQSPAQLKIADEIGLLVMEEVPLNWWRASFRPKVPPEFDNDRIVAEAEKTLEQMVLRDASHPSLAIWSTANECETADERGIVAMERLLRRAKALDPTRLATYVANQNFPKNRAFALADLVAVNLYFGMWDGPVANNLAEIEPNVYAPTRRALEEVIGLFPDKPVLLTEFGTIGIPGSGGDVRFSEDYQAAYVSAVWRAVEAVPEVSGGVVWCWADYRQRKGFTNDFPTFYGPFGLVTFERRPKKAHAAMRELWARSVADGWKAPSEASSPGR
jgi:beta-galactosidase/beta-glucuronidase